MSKIVETISINWAFYFIFLSGRSRLFMVYYLEYGHSAKIVVLCPFFRKFVNPVYLFYPI